MRVEFAQSLIIKDVRATVRSIKDKPGNAVFDGELDVLRVTHSVNG